MTEQVMVPVPEQHVAAVRQLINWGRTAEPDPWSSDQIAVVLDAVDDPTRSVLTTVAQDLTHDHITTVSELSARLGHTPREILGLTIEVNAVVHAKVPGQPFLVMTRRGSLAEGDGSNIEDWQILMGAEAAAHIRSRGDDGER